MQVVPLSAQVALGECVCDFGQPGLNTKLQTQVPPPSYTNTVEREVLALAHLAGDPGGEGRFKQVAVSEECKIPSGMAYCLEAWAFKPISVPRFLLHTWPEFCELS